MQLNPDILFGSVIGLLGAMIYAFSVVVYRSQKDEIRPLAISSIKMWVALPVMALLILFSFGASPFTFPIETIALLSISIVVGAVVGDTLYLMSQERIGVSYAFPIAMSFPILTFVITVAFLGEPLLLSRLGGAVIAIVGIVLISNEQNAEDNPGEEMKGLDIIGISLALCTSVLYAVGTVVLQVGVSDVDPIGANFIRILVGSIVFVPMVTVALKQGMPLPTRKATKLVGIAGFFGMALGSIFYVTAVKYAGAQIVSVLATTAPLFAVPVSVFYLKERLTRIAGLGIILTIAGVILVILGF